MKRFLYLCVSLGGLRGPGCENGSKYLLQYSIEDFQFHPSIQYFQECCSYNSNLTRPICAYKVYNQSVFIYHLVLTTFSLDQKYFFD